MRDLRICFVGDSFINGTGDDEALGWAGRICRSARKRGVPLTRYDLGVRRDTSELILRRCATEVAVRLSGVPCDGRVVFSFGANDAAHEQGRPRVDLATSLANARALLAQSMARHPTLMIGPPPIADDASHDARVGEISNGLNLVCSELGLPYLDLHGPLSVNETWRLEALDGDGAHPNSGGYAAAAALVEEWGPWRNWVA
jgi:lysophospholipase L1-like esterase